MGSTWVLVGFYLGSIWDTFGFDSRFALLRFGLRLGMIWFLFRLCWAFLWLLCWFYLGYYVGSMRVKFVLLGFDVGCYVVSMWVLSGFLWGFIWVLVGSYVCVSVCMCVCMYACLHACVHVCMYTCMCVY